MTLKIPSKPEASACGICRRTSANRLLSTKMQWGVAILRPWSPTIPLLIKSAVAQAKRVPGGGGGTQLTLSIQRLCSSTRPLIAKDARTIPAIACRSGSQEFSETMLPKTIALEAQNHPLRQKPKAPARSAKTRGCT